jgi:subtilisin family serine protease
MKRDHLAFLLFLSASLLIPAMLAAQNHGATIPDRTPQYVPDQLLVRYKENASITTSQKANLRVGAKLKASFSIIPGLQLVQLQAGTDFGRALASYRSDPNVLYAEPNYIRKALDSTPNDLYYLDLWNMHNTGQKISFPYITSDPNNGIPGADIHALEAWGITTGSSDVVIGLIDTGVDYNHEDLAANMYRNQSDCNNNGVDDDGNGYIDDCYGIDALDGTSDPIDQVGHGTHVAGIMGAIGNNSLGVTGVNWNVRILTCKFLGFSGGTDDGAIACLNYMAAMKDKGVNIVATNNSWGGYGYSQALYDAIDAQRQRGVLFVAAAGNSSSDNDGTSPLYPASFSLDNIISVAASTYTDSMAYFSSFGAHSVHIAAPGYRILSTTPHNTYSFYDGTSMATPHVTGVAALLAAQDKTRNWNTIRNLILSSGDKLSSLNSIVTQSRLNAFNAMICNNRTLSVPTLPGSAGVLANVGEPLSIAELNINCGSPGGNLQVSINPGGTSVTLLDDGNAPDKNASDGTYTGQWIPPSPGLYTLSYPGGQIVTVAADPYSYTPSAFQYRNFTGTNLRLNDYTYAFVQSPFPLSFGGGAHEGVYVMDNGYLSFDSLLPQTGQAMPYKYATTIIAPYWDDLVPTATGKVYWTVNGTAPSRELVIEWRNMGHSGCKTDGSESATFQVVFFENSTNVLFNYLKTAFGGTCTANDNGTMASIGMQLAATTAKQYSFQKASLADNTAIMWSAMLPTNPAPSITEVFPQSWVADVFDFYVDITGKNFGNNSVLLVNGSPRTTYVFSSSEIYGVISASDLAVPGTLQLSVFNGLPGGGPSASAAFPVKADDFTVSTSASSVSVRSGQSASFTAYVYSNPAFYDGVTLTCSGLPANATCKFDPASILAGGYSIVTISTAVTTTASLKHESAMSGMREALLLMPLAGLVVIAIPRRSKKKTVGLVMLAAIVLLACSSCGGGGGSTAGNPPSTTPPPGPGTNPTSSPGVYTISITATSGAIKHSATVSLTVTK